MGGLIIRFLIFLAALLVCAPAIFAKLRENRHEGQQFRAGLDSAEQTIGAFRRRRKRAAVYFVLGVAGAAMALVVPETPGYVSLFSATMGLSMFYAAYRCPMCYSMVTAPADYDRGRVLLNPVACGKCHAPLAGEPEA